ncbi:hypothetical protein FXO37_00633 [Capsicum annuum]|nr:hypothetical protein FXO37_00633 [Capsicum annuum]
MHWKLKVLVVLLWEVNDRFSSGDLYAIEMILQDEHGDRIQASICSFVLKQFKSDIKERGLFLSILRSDNQPVVVVLQLIRVHKFQDYFLFMIETLTESLILFHSKVTLCWMIYLMALYKYRIQVTIMDGTGSISLMNWDTDAMSLIGKSANDLKEELLQNTGNDDDPSYPMELNNILQRKFIFKVIVKNKNIQNHDEVYNVVKILDDKDLIKKCSPNESDTSRDHHFTNFEESYAEKNYKLTSYVALLFTNEGPLFLQRTGSRGDSINRNHAEIVQDLKQMLDDQNVLTKSFRMVRDRFQEDSHTNVRLKLIGKRNYDGRRYNLPTISEVAALVVGDFEVSRYDRDIVVETQSGLLQRINELNTSYLALQ